MAIQPVTERRLTTSLANQTGLVCEHQFAAAKTKGGLLDDMAEFYKMFCAPCYLSATFKEGAQGMVVYMPEGRGIQDIVPSADDPIIKAPPNKTKRGRKSHKKRKRSRGELTARALAREDAIGAAGAAAEPDDAAAGQPNATVFSPPATRSRVRRLE